MLLTTGLFHAEASDGQLGRALALQKIMTEVRERAVALDANGQPAFSYAHPMFWAAFALFGDPR